jgi:hypothetical protein
MNRARSDQEHFASQAVVDDPSPFGMFCNLFSLSSIEGLFYTARQSRNQVGRIQKGGDCTGMRTPQLGPLSSANQRRGEFDVSIH